MRRLAGGPGRRRRRGWVGRVGRRSRRLPKAPLVAVLRCRVAGAGLLVPGLPPARACCRRRWCRGCRWSRGCLRRAPGAGARRRPGRRCRRRSSQSRALNRRRANRWGRFMTFSAYKPSQAPGDRSIGGQSARCGRRPRGRRPRAVVGCWPPCLSRRPGVERRTRLGPAAGGGETLRRTVVPDGRATGGCGRSFAVGRPKRFACPVRGLRPSLG